MAANGISTLSTKQAKQKAKLDIASAKRQGKTVAVDGTITGSVDPTKNYYRSRAFYDITQLPTQYTGNAITNNPNSDGLIVGRPWIAISYSIAPNSSAINEGDTVTYTITTVGVADGTTLYWTNAGTTTGPDFTDNADSGSFTVTGGSATFSRALTNDYTTEGTETIIVDIRTGSTSGPIVATSGTVSVADTSQTPAITYTLATAGNVTSVNEGVALTFNVTTTNVDDNTTLYWGTGDNFNGGDFSRYTPGTSGTVTIVSNSGSFTITISADNLTATSNPQEYSVTLYSGNPGYFGGTPVASITNIVVNDTSQTPHSTSLVFTGSSYGQVDGSTTDWDFSVTDNFTVEFWSKAATSSTSTVFTVMSQGPQNGIDVFYENGYLNVFDGHDSYIKWTEPTPNTWTHVAIMNAGGVVYAFYNGVLQTVNSGAWVPGYHWGNATDALYIGQRGSNVSGQNFNGKLTNIRICGTVQYIDPSNIQNFDPYTLALPPSNTTGCVLLINPTSASAVDLSPSQHTGYDINTASSDDYPDDLSYTMRQYLYGYTPGSSNSSFIVNRYDYELANIIPVGATAIYNGQAYTVTNSFQAAPGLGGIPNNFGWVIQVNAAVNFGAGDYMTCTWKGTPTNDIASQGSGAVQFGSPWTCVFEENIPDNRVFYWRIEDGYVAPAGFDTPTSGVSVMTNNRITITVQVTDPGMPGSDATFMLGIYADAGYTQLITTSAGGATNPLGGG